MAMGSWPNRTLKGCGAEGVEWHGAIRSRTGFGILGRPRAPFGDLDGVISCYVQLPALLPRRVLPSMRVHERRVEKSCRATVFGMLSDGHLMAIWRYRSRFDWLMLLAYLYCMCPLSLRCRSR